MVALRLIWLLATKRMSAALLALLTLTYVYFTFGDDPFAEWAAFLFEPGPGLALTSILMLNLFLGAVRDAFRKLRRENVTPGLIMQMDTHREVSLGGPDPLGQATRWIERMGIKVKREAACTIGQTGRFSFIPGLVLRAGLVMFLGALLVSHHSRAEERVMVREGEKTLLFKRIIRVANMDPGLPPEYIEFDGHSDFAINEVSADVVSISTRERISSAYPSGSDGLYMRITDVGIMQPISGRAGGAEFEWDIMLKVLPPGLTDAETMLARDTFLSVALVPHKRFKKGLLEAASYDLAKPSYGLSLLSAEGPGGGESVGARPGESVALGSVEMRLGPESYYIELQAVRDPALPWLYAGLLTALLGCALMPLRLLWYERRAYAFLTYETVFLGYSEEFFDKWGVMKFHRLTEELINGGDRTAGPAESDRPARTGKG